MLKDEFLELRRRIIAKDFERMNDRQQEAIYAVNGPLLLLAGAGSGKTTVLVNRIANLIKYGNAYNSDYSEFEPAESDIAIMKQYLADPTTDLFEVYDLLTVNAPAPWEILAITFTNKAASELKARLAAKLGDAANDIWASTFHSCCARILRRYGDLIGYTNRFTIYDTDDSKRVMKEAQRLLDINDKMLSHKTILKEVSRAKDQLINPDEYIARAGGDVRLKAIGEAYKCYQKLLKNADAMDFDDMIFRTVELLQNNEEVRNYYQNKFKYILVDEYQDTNHAQYVLTSLLAEKYRNICVVGDDDQSIYKFRGATIQNILSFEERYPDAKTIRLEQNYRSTQTILDAANSVISNNVGRKSKKLWTAGAKGEKIYWYKAVDETDEANFVAQTILDFYKETGTYSDSAVLYRMNAQSNAVERMFVKCGIPYRIYGGMRFYDRKEIKDITSYLSFINNPNDMLRFRRIINEPKRGIGDSTVALIEDISRDLKISPYEVLRTCEEYAPLSKKVNALKSVYKMFEYLTEKADELPLDEFLDELLEKTGYLESLKALENGDTKIENVEELRSSIVQYMNEADEPSLSGFLEEVALYSEADRDDGSDDKVTLMTVHSAKGLEYKNIFVIGLDDGIFPSSRSFDSEADMEEERRLAYVAITRAKERLYLTNASQRMLFGQTQRNVTSRFMREIDPSLIEKHDHAAAMRKQLGESDKTLTEVHSTSLQQQLARNKSRSVGAKTSETYTAGERVSHNIFGEGTIVSVKPMANDSMLEIAFEKVGTKKIMANYAKLKKL